MSEAKKINAKTLEEANKIFKLMGNPIRLQILHLLSQQELNVGKIGSILGLEQSAVSHQLSLLKEEQLVSSKREGKSVYYQLDDKHVAHVINDTIEHVEHMSK
ncbi:metalloregulator ArsR/SmtB family transcription factor [Streptococcaceae bacterium ESL0729]|nr:metalloregulator ArsR/SmtB family transcription factor [Streptococcaceae bacterium ESL0729]